MYRRRALRGVQRLQSALYGSWRTHHGAHEPRLLFAKQFPVQGVGESFRVKLERVTLPHSNAHFGWHNFDEARYQEVSSIATLRTPKVARGTRLYRL